MATFLMFGKYSSEGVKEISGERTDEAIGIVKQYDGVVNSMYAMLGEHDLLFIVNFPDIEQAMKASVALNRMTGISFSSFPAISVEKFDKMLADM